MAVCMWWSFFKKKDKTRFVVHWFVTFYLFKHVVISNFLYSVFWITKFFGRSNEHWRAVGVWWAYLAWRFPDLVLSSYSINHTARKEKQGIEMGLKWDGSELLSVFGPDMVSTSASVSLASTCSEQRCQGLLIHPLHSLALKGCAMLKMYFETSS